MSKHKVELKSQNWVTPTPGVRMKVCRRGDTQLRLKYAQSNCCKAIIKNLPLTNVSMEEGRLI